MVNTQQRKFPTLLFIAVLAISFLVGWRLYGKLNKQPVLAQETPIPVEVSEVVRKDIERTVKLVGSIEAASSSNISLKTSGRVAAIYVSLGSKVSVGQTLLELESGDLMSQLKAAQAALELADANLKRIELTAPVMEKAQAEASAKQASAQLDVATKNVERLGRLYESGAVPLAQLEAAQAQWEVAASQLDLAYKNLNVVDSGTSTQAVAAARAQREQAEASLELAQSQLEASVLRAPYSGIVSYLNINPGEMAGAGVPLVGLVEDDSLVAEFMVSEKQVKNLSEGQTISLVLPVLDEETSARVLGIAPAVDPRSRLYMVRAAVTDPPQQTRPGMMAELFVLEESRSEILTVPQECIVGGSVDPAVYVVNAEKAEKRPVRLGISDGVVIEILGGLSEGDIVITKGQSFLKEGRSVAVMRGDF